MTLGADITALKRAMAGLGKGGAAALQKGLGLAGTAFRASINSSRLVEFDPS